MEFVGWMPKDRYEELQQLAQEVVIQTSFQWNCQNWVRELLDAMAARGFITEKERDAAKARQQEAVRLAFTTESPNAAALHG